MASARFGCPKMEINATPSWISGEAAIRNSQFHPPESDSILPLSESAAPRIPAVRRQLLSGAKGCALACAIGLLGTPAMGADRSSSLSDSIQQLMKGSMTSVQFGGFVSQGFIANTGHNKYLGDTSAGTFDFREYGVNASYAIGKWRLGIQAFGQKLGDYGNDKLDIDWATVDYQPAQWFGVRAGRVKMPRGLYNEALDLDSVRPFVLLPQSVYDARLRDFNASFNGGMIFGNVSLKEAGSIDYRAFFGDIPIGTESGASDYFNNDYPSVGLGMKMDSVAGGSVFWNTPLAGLRLGYSYSSFQNLSSVRRADLPLNGLDQPFVNVVGTKSTDSYQRHLFSVEYTKGNWVFAAEAGRDSAFYNTDLAGAHYLDMDFNSDYYYLSVARRINSWLELGVYYSHSRDTEPLVNSPYGNLSLPVLKQNDFAVSARFDINEHLVFKLEGHYMLNAGKVFDTVENPQPVSGRDNSWFLFAAKLTFSF